MEDETKDKPKKTGILTTHDTLTERIYAWDPAPTATSASTHARIYPKIRPIVRPRTGATKI